VSGKDKFCIAYSGKQNHNDHSMSLLD